MSSAYKPSKVRRDIAVPVTAATVTVVWLLPAFKGTGRRHITVVPLVHDVVPQSAPATNAVEVASTAEKLNPLIVAAAPQQVGALPLPTRTDDTAGAAERVSLCCKIRIRQKHQTEERR